MKYLNFLTLATIQFLAYSPLSYAYKISVYTDQADNSKALEVVKTFKSTYPFNKFDIEIDIKTVPADKLNCKPLYGIARLIGCDSEKIAKEASRGGVDQVFIVKDSPVYGGSGGSIPVITTNTTPKAILHEYLHTLGLCDEYTYSASEATNYCSLSGLNMAIIQPNPAGYTSDLDARSQHMNAIPWKTLISENTPITRSTKLQLGTGSVNSTVFATPNSTNSTSTLGSKIGLYEGKTCINATPPKKTWQPGQEASIMEFLDAGLGASNEVMVENILKSRGVLLKNEEIKPLPIEVNNETRQNIKSSGVTSPEANSSNVISK